MWSFWSWCLSWSCSCAGRSCGEKMCCSVSLAEVALLLGVSVALVRAYAFMVGRVVSCNHVWGVAITPPMSGCSRFLDSPPPKWQAIPGIRWRHGGGLGAALFSAQPCYYIVGVRSPWVRVSKRTCANPRPTPAPDRRRPRRLLRASHSCPRVSMSCSLSPACSSEGSGVSLVV